MLYVVISTAIFVADLAGVNNEAVSSFVVLYRTFLDDLGHKLRYITMPHYQAVVVKLSTQVNFSAKNKDRLPFL